MPSIRLNKNLLDRPDCFSTTIAPLSHSKIKLLRINFESGYDFHFEITLLKNEGEDFVNLGTKTDPFKKNLQLLILNTLWTFNGNPIEIIVDYKGDKAYDFTLHFEYV